MNKCSVMQSLEYSRHTDFPAVNGPVNFDSVVCSSALRHDKKVGKRWGGAAQAGLFFQGRPNGGNKRHKLLQIGPFEERSQINRLQLIVKFTIDRSLKGGGACVTGSISLPGKNTRQSKDRIAAQYCGPQNTAVFCTAVFYAAVLCTAYK